MSIVFLLYCYIVLLLHPRWKTTIQKFKVMMYLSKAEPESGESLGTSYTTTTVHRQISHDSPSAGSLFLRLGAVGKIKVACLTLKPV